MREPVTTTVSGVVAFCARAGWAASRAETAALAASRWRRRNAIGYAINFTPNFVRRLALGRVRPGVFSTDARPVSTNIGENSLDEFNHGVERGDNPSVAWGRNNIARCIFDVTSEAGGTLMMILLDFFESPGNLFRFRVRFRTVSFCFSAPAAL